MSALTRALGVSVAIGGLFHLAIKAQAKKIRSFPDPYPFDVLSREPEGEETFIERADGTRLRAVHQGEGPPVVLAHGYGATILEWNILWDLLLASGHRVIAFDQRGHGRSSIGSDGIGSSQMAGDYRAILEHFDVKDGILVGHSMGGFLAMLFLLEHAECAAERLRGAVLMATTAGQILQGAPQNRLQIPLIASGLMTKIIRSEAYGLLFGASVMGDAPSPAGIEAFNQVFVAQQHDQLVPILRAIGDEDHYPRLNEIQLPVVVVCGEKDKTTPAWHSTRIGQEIPGARNVWLPGKGHMLNWEAPEAIVEAVASLSA